jgi:hypothetical protein
MNLRRALDRTLLLMRDEVQEGVDDNTLLGALTGTHVALVADEANIASHSAQTAFVTAAMLMARSGHRVHLLCPDVPLTGPQPPLGRGRLTSELVRIGDDLLPGIGFGIEPPEAGVDFAVALGNSAVTLSARRRMCLNADSWSGRIVPVEHACRWSGDTWPLGGMAAAALVASETFKIAMRKLRHVVRNPERLATVFAEPSEVEFALAPSDTPTTTALGAFDCVSGGAIIQSVLYALARIPEVTGRARVIEPDRADLSNLNRYMLLLRSHAAARARKAEQLALACADTGLAIEPVNERYAPGRVQAIQLGPSVLVGVDDIPTRWLVQRSNPEWLGSGATTHWSAMASFHEPGLGCAECLHPRDDPSDALIPTVAFVSFWAGLLTTTYFLRHLAGSLHPAIDQQIYMTPFRAENSLRAEVPLRNGCPSCEIMGHGSPALLHTPSLTVDSEIVEMAR